MPAKSVRVRLRESEADSTKVSLQVIEAYGCIDIERQ
jgi:hypothetical protein